MKYMVIFVAALVSTAAVAQQPAPPARYTLTVTPQDLATISTALAARPFGEVNDLWQRLAAQIGAQNQPKPQQDEKPVEGH